MSGESTWVRNLEIPWVMYPLDSRESRDEDSETLSKIMARILRFP